MGWIMNVNDKLKVIADVAFNNNVRKINKVSYSKTIDVQFGIYNTGEHNGWLTINLKPTHGIIDWIINFIALPRNHIHAGYLNEWEKYKNKFIRHILDDERLIKALQVGVIIAGRSKGGGEALIIADDISDMQGDNILVGAIEPPKVCDERYKEFIERKIGIDNIIYTIYKNDIVPSLPFWFTHAGTGFKFGKRTIPLSSKDHIKFTTDEDLVYKAVGLGNSD